MGVIHSTAGVATGAADGGGESVGADRIGEGRPAKDATEGRTKMRDESAKPDEGAAEGKPGMADAWRWTAMRRPLVKVAAAIGCAWRAGV